MQQSNTSFLPVMEHFYTLQGEGKFTGHAAYFIRLGGCDVGCVWCDVKESWEADAHPSYSVEEIANWTGEYPSEHVVITGGEPAMYDLTPLTDALHEKGKYLAIETSGAHEIKGHLDWVTFSPKKFKAPVDQIYSLANELKVVVYHKSDLEWAMEHAAKVNSNCLLYLQPEWSKQEQLLPLIIEFVKQHPQWRVSIQTHKYLAIP